MLFEDIFSKYDKSDMNIVNIIVIIYVTIIIAFGLLFNPTNNGVIECCTGCPMVFSNY